MLATLSAIASTLLMLHFLRRLLPSAEQEPRVAPSAELVLPWLAIALASIAVPWALYPEIANESLHDVLASKALWEALGPVLIGALMAFKMRRWEYRLPRIPAGDVLAVGILVAAWATRNLSAAMERVDGYLRQWPVVGVLFLALTIILAGTMLTGR